jgi:ribosome-associated toxin RatA of RatAB toxin-antitoxin module
MAEHTRSSITIDAAPAAVMGVIADFGRYPEWTGEVKEAQVLSRDADGRAEQVRLLLDAGAIKDDHTLAYTWISADEVRWSLVKSQMLRTLDGSYALAPLDGGRRTEVTYQLTVDVKIPMLGMIKRKAEKVIIDRALAGLKKRVESQPEPAREAQEAQEAPADDAAGVAFAKTGRKAGTGAAAKGAGVDAPDAETAP